MAFTNYLLFITLIICSSFYSERGAAQCHDSLINAPSVPSVVDFPPKGSIWDFNFNSSRRLEWGGKNIPVIIEQLNQPLRHQSAELRVSLQYHNEARSQRLQNGEKFFPIILYFGNKYYGGSHARHAGELVLWGSGNDIYVTHEIYRGLKDGYEAYENVDFLVGKLDENGISIDAKQAGIEYLGHMAGFPITSIDLKVIKTTKPDVFEHTVKLGFKLGQYDRDGYQISFKEEKPLELVNPTF